MMDIESESFSKDSQVRLESLLPVIKSISAEILEHQWGIFFNDVYFHNLCDPNANQLKTEVYKDIHQLVVTADGQTTRKSIDINSTPFTIAIFPENHEVRFYSVNLSDELFLVQEFNKANSQVLEGQEFSLLKHHLEVAASIEVARFPTSIEELTAKYDLPDLVSGEAFEKVEIESAELTNKLIEKINEYRLDYLSVRVISPLGSLLNTPYFVFTF